MNKLVVEMDSDTFTDFAVYCAGTGETKKAVVTMIIRKWLAEHPARKVDESEAKRMRRFN